MGVIREPQTSRYYIREILESCINLEEGKVAVSGGLITNLLRDYAVLEYLLDERRNLDDIYKGAPKEYMPAFIYPDEGTWESQSKGSTTGNIK